METSNNSVEKISQLFETLIKSNGTLEEAVIEHIWDTIWQTVSGDDLIFLKWHYTDGLATHIDPETGKPSFLLQECKAKKTVGSTIKGWTTCIRKALLQECGYFFQFERKRHTDFGTEVVKVSKECGYSDSCECIVDNMKVFVITTDRFAYWEPITDSFKTKVIDKLRPIIGNSNAASTLWTKFPEARSVMEDYFIDVNRIFPIRYFTDVTEVYEQIKEFIHDSNAGATV